MERKERDGMGRKERDGMERKERDGMGRKERDGMERKERDGIGRKERNGMGKSEEMEWEGTRRDKGSKRQDGGFVQCLLVYTGSVYGPGSHLGTLPGVII